MRIHPGHPSHAAEPQLSTRPLSQVLCRKKYDQTDVQAFALMIEEEYRSHFLLDNLPIAMSVFHESEDGTTTKVWVQLLPCTVSSPPVGVPSDS